MAIHIRRRPAGASGRFWGTNLSKSRIMVWQLLRCEISCYRRMVVPWVTAFWVPEVPLSWETLYPPWFSSFPYQIHSGRQDPQSTVSLTFMHQYVLINLKTGSFEALTDAPTSYAAGWFASGDPSWSNDGQAVLLPGTFIKSKDNAPSRPVLPL